MCRRLLPPCLLALVLAGCDIFGKPADYFPTGVGSVWEYQGYWTQTTPSDSTDSSAVSIRTEAAFRTRLNDETEVTAFIQALTAEFHFPYETTMTLVDTVYYLELKSAVLCYQDLGDTTADTVLSLPLAAGKCWGDSASARYTCVSQEDLTVAAGSYRKAWKISVEPVQGDYHQWYANRVGLVQIHSESEYMPGYRSTSHYELVSATVK